MAVKPTDHTGKKFGKWIVLHYNGKQYWQCRCTCGKEQSIYSGNLVSGSTHSCNQCSVETSSIHRRRYAWNGHTGLKEIGAAVGVHYQTIWARMRRGMTLEQAAEYKRPDPIRNMYAKLGVSRQGFHDYMARHGYADTMRHYKEKKRRGV